MLAGRHGPASHSGPSLSLALLPGTVAMEQIGEGGSVLGREDLCCLGGVSASWKDQIASLNVEEVHV